jgi:L-lactate dehydrogenase complex protein LldE
MTHIVQLFVTCIIDSLYPEVGEAVVRVLHKSGVRVEFPSGQTCCGQPAFNAGMRPEAARMAKHTIRVFEATQGSIVIPSGSCTAMIRHGYLELFATEPEWLERARAIAGRAYEFTEFLVDQLGVLDFGANFSGSLVYHPSCHLTRDLGVRSQPRQLLNNVRGASLVELPNAEDCCGFGGVFSVEHPELSAEMLKRKLENIQDSRAGCIVACDAGCITNINGGLHRAGKLQRAVHIAQVLDGELE